MRRFLTILTIIGILALGVLSYYFLRPYINPVTPAVVDLEKTPHSTTTFSSEEFTPGAFTGDPTLENGSENQTGIVSLLYDTSLLDYWLDPADRSVFLVVENGKIIKAGAGGSRETLFSFDPKIFVSVTPAPDGSKFILVTKNALGNEAFLVNTVTGEQTALLSGTISAAWSPDGESFSLFVEPQGENRPGLYIFSATSGRERSRLSLSLFDVALFWPEADYIYLQEKSSYLIESSLFVFRPSANKMFPVLQNVTGLLSNWTAGVNWGVYSSTKELRLGVVAPDGETASFRLWTLPQKCTVASEGIYCGVPYNSLKKSNMPDAYLQKSSFTLDSIYKINPSTKEETELFSGILGRRELDVYKPQKMGEMLYFINRYDKALYGLVLE